MSFESFMENLGRAVRGVLDPVTVSRQPDVSATRTTNRPATGAIADEEIAYREGRYIAGGYGWSSREQAEHFLQRLKNTRPRSAEPHAAQTIASPPPRPPTLPRELRQVEPGVWEDGDGRFHAAGYSFSTVEQARFHAVRQWRRNDPAASPPRVDQVRSRSAAPRLSRTEAAPIKSMREPERWIGSPTTIRVNGVTFEAELTYVGTPKDKYAYPRNNALIDPNLSVAFEGDPRGSTLSYWPDYADLNPRARRSYLEWLASGRSNADTPIGYVFVYFYGLERRLVYERSDADAEAILAELRRLMAIYGGNSSFARYATLLIEFGDALHHAPAAPLIPTLERTYNYEIPLGIRIALGQLLADNQPLDANQALCWLLALPDTYTRTPVNRCFDEFVALWRVRFDQTYPEGLKLRTPKSLIQVHYRPASGGYHANATIEGLPDIAQVAAPIPRLRELFMACSDELDSFSRYLGRFPDARASLEAATLLPSELRDTEFGKGARECLERFAELFADSNRAALTTQQLLALLGQTPLESQVGLSSQAGRQVAGMLDALGIGFEPDRRYGACGALTADTYVCAFRADRGGSVAPDVEHYVAARALTEIAALAATADGVVVPLEVEAIQRDLASLDLAVTEQARLLAHAEAILRNPPKARAAIKRLLALPEERRRRIAQSAISAVLADGHVLSSEVRFLEGLYKALGFPNEDIYAQLHRGSVEIDEPVAVEKAISETGIPLPPEAVADRFVAVDAAKLERLRKETSQVSSLLATIFVDYADVRPGPAVADAAVGEDRFAGLGRAHGELLALLLSAPMERGEFEEAARARKLMPEGALETINDWSFDQFEEPAVEDEDMILIAAHLLGPIKALEKVAR
ncbi:MAG TPA: TerB N-terminal domain-containing protein [Allosphingosinicella sp.]|nr:TerB N-terminal domain-containing protein [Allosphingosinicella sp.]